MKLNDTFRAFLREHASDDLNRLLLSASRYPGIDVPLAVEQIAARRQIRDKLPAWYRNDTLYFPARMAAEQCSSEATALYKAGLIAPGETLCDLTGGLGIDTYYFSQRAASVVYIERFAAYAEAARHNFAQLGADNIRVMEGDSTALFDTLENVETFYIDPARRGEGNRRVFALSDCQPDLTLLLPRLLEKAPRVVAKLSPMADLKLTLDLLPGTVAVHILSVRNECKELIFVIEKDAWNAAQEKDAGQDSASAPVFSALITCVNFTASGKKETYSFTLAEETNAPTLLACAVGSYVYEPNASILKAGAFKSIAARMQLNKLHVSSHLYTSDSRIADFPGRIFQVEEIIPFHGKTLKNITRALLQANLTVRNFPLSAAELRKRLKLKEGGDTYLLATTLAGGEKVLIRCVKPEALPSPAFPERL